MIVTDNLSQNRSIDRAMLFIDGGNLYHSLRTHCSRIDLDYGKFVGKLVGERRLVRAYYYGARVDQSKQQQAFQAQQQFLDYLGRVPRLETRMGRLVYRNWPGAAPAEKGVDIKIATDMLLHAARNTYDVAILVSGDTDFVDMVQGVKDLGKNVEVVLFGSGGSRVLREVADEVIPVDYSFLADCWR